MTADDVRGMYDEPPGTKVPRFPLFARECVGVLIDKVAELESQLSVAGELVAHYENLLPAKVAEIGRLKASLTAAYDRIEAQGGLPSKRAGAEK